MNKVTLYSKSRRPAAAEPAEAAAPVRTARAARLRGFLSRHERILLVAVAVLLSVGAFLAYNSMKPPPRQLTQKDIDAAVLHTLDTNVAALARGQGLRGRAALGRARARSSSTATRPTATMCAASAPASSSSTTGIILTNLHVVAGAEADQGRPSSTAPSRTPTVIGAQPGERPRGAAGARRSPTTCRRRRCARPPTSRPATRWSRSAFRSASARRCRPASSPGCKREYPLARGQAAC